MLLVLCVASPAFGYTYTELNGGDHTSNVFMGLRKTTAKYGVSASIQVIDQPGSRAKNYSVVAHKADWTGWTECGYRMFSNWGQPFAFTAWGEYGDYHEVRRKNVYHGETHSYWTGYNPSNYKYYFWIDNTSTALASVSNTELAGMTSCYATLNVDGRTEDGDFLYATFINPKYRNATWGSWSSFGTTYLVDDYNYNNAGWDWGYWAGTPTELYTFPSGDPYY